MGKELPPINENDVVLAYHGPLIYEAKVLSTSIEGENEVYFVHYKGWSNKWNEWVNRDRVMVDTPANRDRQEAAKYEYQKQRAQKKKGKKRPQSTKNNNKSKKRKAGDLQPEEEDLASKQVSISMPFTLKKQLVNEWERVAKEPIHLIALPRAPCVAQIIENYVAHKQKNAKTGGQPKVDSIRELLDGIRIYFNRALGTILLYRTERKQYEDIKKQYPDKTMAELYGAEHLIRLFVRLPNLLGQTTINDAEKRQIQARLSDFLKYLQKNHSAWFSTDFQPVSEEYTKENNKLYQ